MLITQRNRIDPSLIRLSNLRRDSGSLLASAIVGILLGFGSAASADVLLQAEIAIVVESSDYRVDPGESAHEVSAIGGTRLRAIGGTRLRAIGGTRLRAIGGTYLRAIGGTRLRSEQSEELQALGGTSLWAIGGTRLRADHDEAHLYAIGGTRLRAIGGTRLRSDHEAAELFAIGGTRLRAIGGTRLRGAEEEIYQSLAIGGTRLRSTDIQSTHAIGGTRLRATSTDSELSAIGGTRLRSIEDTSNSLAIGGTRLRTIGGTQVHSMAPSVAFSSDNQYRESSTPEQTSAQAFLLDSSTGYDVFVLGPVTSQNDAEIAVLGISVDATSLNSAEQQSSSVGKLALLIGNSSSGEAVFLPSEEWFIAGTTNVAVLSRITHVDHASGRLTLSPGLVVELGPVLASRSISDFAAGQLIFVSGVAY